MTAFSAISLPLRLAALAAIVGAAVAVVLMLGGESRALAPQTVAAGSGKAPAGLRAVSARAIKIPPKKKKAVAAAPVYSASTASTAASTSSSSQGYTAPAASSGGGGGGGSSSGGSSGGTKTGGSGGGSGGSHAPIVVSAPEE